MLDQGREGHPAQQCSHVFQLLLLLVDPCCVEFLHRYGLKFLACLPLAQPLCHLLRAGGMRMAGVREVRQPPRPAYDERYKF